MKFIRIILLVLLASQLTKSQQQKQLLLQGKHLNVAMANIPPSSAIIRNSSGHAIGYSGSFPDQLNWISRRLKFDYCIIPSPDKNGYQDMVEKLERGEVDLSIGPHVLRQRNEKYNYDLAGYLGAASGFSMLVRYPSSSSSYSSLFCTLEPFHYKVWIGIIGSLIAITAVSSLIVYVRVRFFRTDSDLKTVDLFMHFFKTILAQSNSQMKKSHNRLFVRILLITWMYASFVLLTSYNSTIISYLSISYTKPEVSTLKDLVSDDRFHLITPKGSSIERDFKGGITKISQQVYAKLQRCTDCSSNDFDSIAKKVMDERKNYVALLPKVVSNALIEKFSSKRGECKLTLGHDEFATQWHHLFFAVPKTSSYKKDIELQSLWNIAHGFHVYWERTREYTGTGQCLLNYNNKGVDTQSVLAPLNLTQLFVPFLVLFCGCLLALFQFIREKMHNHLNRKDVKPVRAIPADAQVIISIHKMIQGQLNLTVNN